MLSITPTSTNAINETKHDAASYASHLLHPILTAATPVMLANIVSKLELLYRHLALWAISHQQTPFFEGDQPPCVSKMSSIMSPVRELPFLGTDSK
jgi:hypothetical protein